MNQTSGAKVLNPDNSPSTPVDGRQQPSMPPHGFSGWLALVLSAAGAAAAIVELYGAAVTLAAAVVIVWIRRRYPSRHSWLALLIILGGFGLSLIINGLYVYRYVQASSALALDSEISQPTYRLVVPDDWVQQTSQSEEAIVYTDPNGRYGAVNVTTSQLFVSAEQFFEAKTNQLHQDYLKQVPTNFLPASSVEVVSSGREEVAGGMAVFKTELRFEVDGQAYFGVVYEFYNPNPAIPAEGLFVEEFGMGEPHTVYEVFGYTQAVASDPLASLVRGRIETIAQSLEPL